MKILMSDVPSTDAALAAEIERLKAAVPKTRDLYREVCALLFFRFGVTPTANRLYQLVRRGSMSTPTEVLAEFWAQLREKSRVRIDRPDLPPEIQAAAGDLVAALWDRSTAAAHAAVQALRVELESEREAGQAAVTAAHEAAARAEAALKESRAALLSANARIQALEQAQAVGDATRRSLEGEIVRLQQENREKDAAQAQARADFARELEKVREDAQRAAERLRAAEKHALMEIERERATSARLLKERDAAARRAEDAEARQQADARALQMHLGDARQRIGMLEGSLDAARRATAGYLEELKALRQQGLAALQDGMAGRNGRRKGEAMAGAARRLARSAGRAYVRKKAI